MGGSLDYIEAAALSEGGLSILALPSTTADGKHSKICVTLDGGGQSSRPPRFCTDSIVTEYGGSAQGAGARARAEALIAIAHPQFRDALAQSV